MGGPSHESQCFIDSGMRVGIRHGSTREHTITLYVDKAAFLDVLGMDDDSMIYTMLIDREGTVLWRMSGLLDVEQEEAPSDFLQARPTSA